LWKFLADARLLMAPALSTDKIYIVTTLGTLYALEAKPATSTVTAIHHGEGGRAGDAHVGPHSSVPGV